MNIKNHPWRTGLWKSQVNNLAAISSDLMFANNSIYSLQKPLSTGATEWETRKVYNVEFKLKHVQDRFWELTTVQLSDTNKVRSTTNQRFRTKYEAAEHIRQCLAGYVRIV